jgi:autotransporter-associated beta strand protein
MKPLICEKRYTELVSDKKIPSNSVPSTIMAKKHRLYSTRRLAGGLAASLVGAAWFSSSAFAANTSHTLTTTGANNLSTATWTGGAPTNSSIGDMAIYTTATTASTTTIDTNVTLGGFRTNNTGVWTLSAGVGTLTLDATGLTSGNQPFGNAGVAFLANTSTAAGGLTVNSNITLANTNLDIGTTGTGSTIIGGNITASTAQSISFRANGTGAITDSGNIGASGSNIAISNLGTSTGGVTLSGSLGTSVTSVTQNSSTSALTLSGANSYTGATNVTTGTLTLSGSISSSSALVFGGNALGAATLSYTATAGSTQTFASTTLNSGFSTITNGTASNVVNLGAITRNAGSILNVSSLTGTTNTSSAVDSTGILGTGITTGTTTGLKYAAGGSGGAITAYTGTAAATAANVTDTTGAVNYDVAAVGTLGASASFNTLRYTGAAGTIAGNFTANGLMNAGTGAVTYSGNVTIGANKELVIVGNTQATTISGAIADNGGGASSLTYGGPSAGTLTLSGVNTYTGATNITQGNFTVSGAGQLNSGNYAGNIFQAGSTFTYSSSAAQTLSGSISGAGTVVKSGTGTLTLSGANTYTGGTRANAGTTILSGSHTKSSIGGGDFLSVNNVGAQNAVLKITAGTHTYTDFNIGEATNSRAAVYQTGGDWSTGTTNGIGIKIGSGTTSYGYYNLSGGTLTLAQVLDFQVGGGTGATGVMDVSGGSVTTGSWIVLGRNGAGNGLLNVTGGSVTSQSNNIALNWANTSGSLSVLNVGGGAGAASVTGVSNAANYFDVSQSNTAGTTGVANLLSNGTLTVAKVQSSNAGSTALFNFNGGTLKATATNAGAAFMTSANVDAVTVYSGGGTIHNNGTNITVGNVLGAATGNGITSIAVTDGGSGYIGAPMVKITGGTGNSATGYAVMTDDGTGNGTYKVSSIVITSPGTYSVDPTTVTLSGGGATTAATIGTITTGANTSGGMTFSGSGTTTLSGANTYTGATTINSGTLKLASTGSLASTTYSIAAGAVLDVSAKSSYSLSGQTITLSLDASSIGAFNTGTVALDLGSAALTLNVTTATPGASYDLLTSSALATNNLGSVTLGGSFSGSLSNSGGVWTGSSNGYNFSLDQTTGALTITAVPEPHEFALAIVGLLGVLVFIRRRNQQA